MQTHGVTRMAVAGASQPRGKHPADLPASQLASREIRIRLTRGAHAEDLTIRTNAFQLPGNTYHECSAKSSPCCTAAFTDGEVDGVIQEECDTTFGPRRWVYSGYEWNPVVFAGLTN